MVYSCKVCKTRFSSRNQLQKHVEKKSASVQELTGTLADFCGSERFSDMGFVVGDKRKTIPAHQLVVCPASEVWAGQMKAGSTLIELLDVRVELFGVALKAIYSDSLSTCAERYCALVALSNPRGQRGRAESIRRALQDCQACSLDRSVPEASRVSQAQNSFG